MAKLEGGERTLQLFRCRQLAPLETWSSLVGALAGYSVSSVQVDGRVLKRRDASYRAAGPATPTLTCRSLVGLVALPLTAVRCPRWRRSPTNLVASSTRRCCIEVGVPSSLW